MAEENHESYINEKFLAWCQQKVVEIHNASPEGVSDTITVENVKVIQYPCNETFPRCMLDTGRYDGKFYYFQASTTTNEVELAIYGKNEVRTLTKTDL